jgi:hypothetical protein
MPVLHTAELIADVSVTNRVLAWDKLPGEPSRQVHRIDAALRQVTYLFHDGVAPT